MLVHKNKVNIERAWKGSPHEHIETRPDGSVGQLDP